MVHVGAIFNIQGSEPDDEPPDELEAGQQHPLSVTTPH